MILDQEKLLSRNNTHSACINCPFKANLVYSKTLNCLKFTTTVLEHNHVISEELYNAITDIITRKLKMNTSALELQETLDKARTTTYNIKTTINERFGYNLSRQDIANLRKSKQSNEPQAEQLWEEIQVLLQSDPSSVRILKNANNELECVFIQLSFMREWFIKYPQIHHIDSTFKVNIENFQLYISMVYYILILKLSNILTVLQLIYILGCK